MRTKFKILLLILSFMIPNSFAQSVLHLPDANMWQGDLANACVESAKRKKSKVVDLAAGCNCVARNILTLASYEESSADAYQDLRWVKDYFNGKVKQREIEADPLTIAEHLFHFSQACAQNPSYSHNFGPNN